MRRFAMMVVAVSMSAGVWAPSALGATDPQPSGDPAIAQPSQGTRGDRPQGDQPFQHRDHRGGPGMNGQPPSDATRWGGQGNGQPPSDGPRWGDQGNGQQPPGGSRWGGQGNGQDPQNGSNQGGQGMQAPQGQPGN